MRKYLQLVRCRPYQPETYFIKFHFLGFFLYIRNIYFQEHLRVLFIYLFIYLFTYLFFKCNVPSKNLLSLFLCFFKKPDVSYLFSANWVPFNLFFKSYPYIEMKVQRHHLFNYLLFYCKNRA